MAVGNDSTVFFPNNRIPTSPTRNVRSKPRNVVFPVQNAKSKLYLDLSCEQNQWGKQCGKGWNKGRHSPSKQVSGLKTPPSSPVGMKTPQGGNAPFYAGFTESPAPGSLPKPPTHWVVPTTMSTGLDPADLSSRQLPFSIKSFLDVHA